MIKVKGLTNEKFNLPCLKSIALGDASALLIHDTQEHVKMLQETIKFEYCRFHALFHESMFVVKRDEEGKLHYNWTTIDKIYDFLLSVGIRPFVELNPMPKALASGEKTIFWYEMNVTPPADYNEWYDLIYSFVEHITDRYGVEEIKKWYFEVWNEPNLVPGFWTSDMNEYFKLYEYAAKAVKAVNCDYKVGGPATAVAGWVTEIIDFCADNNVPIDFISTHIYPQDEYKRYIDREGSPHEPGMFCIDNMKKVQELVRNSKMPDLEIHWTEWNTQTADCTANFTTINNKAVDTIFGGACVIRNMVESRKYYDSLSYWVGSDIFRESEMRYLPFSCVYGLINVHGIKKATFNAFALMRKMRGTVVETDCKAPYGCGSVLLKDENVYRLLLWNNKLPEVEEAIWEDALSLEDIETKNPIAISAKIRNGKGSPYETWKELGSPANLSVIEEELLKNAGEMDYGIENIEENCLKFTLNPNEVLYIEIRNKSYSADKKSNDEKLNKELTTK